MLYDAIVRFLFQQSRDYQSHSVSTSRPEKKHVRDFNSIAALSVVLASLLDVKTFPKNINTLSEN